MYIERGALKDVPKNAIIISEDQVVKHYQNYIFGTSQSKEVRALKYGFVAAGAAAFFSNYSLVNYYRGRLKLTGQMVKLFTNFCCVAVPAGFAATFHITTIVPDILLQSACSNCLYIKSALIQNLFSVFYGIGPSAVMIFTAAGLRYSYPVPGFSCYQDIKDTYLLWLKFSKRIMPRILLFTIANTIVITTITFAEFKSFDAMTKILDEQNQKLRKVVEEYQKEKQ